ncbi:MAG: extracellular solute-binding protein, partial [Oscillospiraceae bacterium]|nr:extracellular solute-binding protein [Oscillospiraceae bacterium]
MKIKQKIMIAVLAFLPILGGCSADSISGSNDKASAEYSEGSSAVPFDIVSEPFTADTPNLQYLGSTDLAKTPAYELYIKNYAQNIDGSIIEWEHVSPEKLAERLSERISSDLSPDLCDKLDNSFPYLANKNIYEDLTKYIDITAPQWESYAEFITSSGVGGNGRYFYPTTITVSPYVLLYKKSAFERYSTDDPLTLWHNGEWTFSAMERSLGGGTAIGGSSLAENLLAASGVSLFTVDRNGKVTSNLHSEGFADSAAFIASNCGSEGQTHSYYLQSGIESLQSGKYVYLSITESELNKVRRDYPQADYEIVPFPRSDSADKQYYYAAAEGYLVPKRAKNIKAAASFINCSRIAAQTNGISSKTSNLTETD